MIDNQERTRAWRRHKNRVNKQRDMSHVGEMFKLEKNWKFLYFRSVKLKRAKQLGFEYPRINSRQLLEQEGYFSDPI